MQYVSNLSRTFYYLNQVTEVKGRWTIAVTLPTLVGLYTQHFHLQVDRPYLCPLTFAINHQSQCDLIHK